MPVVKQSLWVRAFSDSVGDSLLVASSCAYDLEVVGMKLSLKRGFLSTWYSSKFAMNDHGGFECKSESGICAD